MQKNSLIQLASVCALATALPADTTLTVPPGTTADIDVALTITTFLGSDTESDSGEVAIDDSFMVVDPNPGNEPFTSLLITEHEINTSGANLDFCFYPFFGTCGLDLDVQVEQLDVQLINDLNVSVDADGNWFASVANYDIQMNLSYQASIIGSGTAEATASASVSVGGNIDVESGQLIVSQLDLATIDIEIDPASLPDGLDALRVVVDADFSDMIYSGNFNTCDLDGDGSVGGSDLTILLGEWGTCCIGDIDGSGNVDGADLTILLACWTG